MALVNSLGNAPQEIWDASIAGRCGIIEVPRSKWNHDLYYEPESRGPGQAYCNVGAFQNIDISRKELGIAPQDFRTMADSTKLTLWLAEQVTKIGTSGFRHPPGTHQRADFPELGRSRGHDQRPDLGRLCP